MSNPALAGGALLCALAFPAAASPGDVTVPCQTPADMSRLVRHNDLDASITFYRGLDLKPLLRALVDQVASPASQDLGKSTIVGIFVSSNADANVIIRFYDAEGCDFYGLEGPPAALQQTLQHLGVGA